MLQLCYDDYMARILLNVAALLLGNLAIGNAAAADLPEHKSNSARKVLATLDMLGLNNQYVKNLVEAADARVEKKYFYFNEQKVGEGRLALRYKFGNGDTPSMPGNSKRLELHYQPKDSRFEVTAHTNSVFLSYHLQLQ